MFLNIADDLKQAIYSFEDIINSITKNELNVNYMSNNSFHISEMNKDLISKMMFADSLEEKT